MGFTGFVMRLPLVLLCLLPAAACQGDGATSPSPIDRSVVLAPGQTARVASGVSVGFVAVVGDSRCPINAACFRAGDATVRVMLTGNKASGERDLNTATTAPVTFEDLEVDLLDLQPFPFAGRTTDPHDYRATIRVRR